MTWFCGMCGTVPMRTRSARDASARPPYPLFVAARIAERTLKRAPFFVRISRPHERIQLGPVDNQQVQMKAAESATNDENRSESLS